MGSAVKPELHVSDDAAPAFERILEREKQLLEEVERAREQGQALIDQARNSKDEIHRKALEEAHTRAIQEADTIHKEAKSKIKELKKQHAQERAVFRSELESTIDPAVDMVVAMVTGAADATQGGEA